MTTYFIIASLSMGFIIATAQANKKIPYTKVTIVINAPIDSAFDHIVPVELPHIFKRYKRFPAIINASSKEGWNKPGLTRTVTFEDGSTVTESLLTVVPSTSFSYRIENFTSQLRFLAKRIEGDWLFIDLGNGQTKIEWTYRIVPKNFIGRAIINWMLLKDIKGLLTNALIILKDDLERD